MKKNILKSVMAMLLPISVWAQTPLENYFGCDAVCTYDENTKTLTIRPNKGGENTQQSWEMLSNTNIVANAGSINHDLNSRGVPKFTKNTMEAFNTYSGTYTSFVRDKNTGKVLDEQKFSYNYVDIVPSTKAVNQTAGFNIFNTLPGTYDLYVVTCPIWLSTDYTTIEESLWDARPYRFYAYVFERENEGENMGEFPSQVDPLINPTDGTNFFETCGKAYRKDGHVIVNDTTYLGQYTFKKTNNNSNIVDAVIQFQPYITSKQTEQFSREMLISSIILKPHDMPLRNQKEDIEHIVMGNGVTKINYALGALGYDIQTVEIPNSVTSIGNYAFSGCRDLTSLSIPNSVISIGNSAFAGCSGLTSINIPSSVTSLGNSAFANCYGLTSINLGNGITSIDSKIFESCNSLKSIYIGNSVTSIGDNAFDNCQNLTSIKVGWNRPLSISNYLTRNIDKKNCILYVPQGTASMYMSAPVWMEFVNIVEYEDGANAHYITIRMGDGGVLKQSVETGKTYTYTICADEGWEVSTLTFDGKDMTTLLMDGQFSTPVITGDSELNVVFRQKGNDIKAMPTDSKVKVYASNKSITVKGADDNSPVNVYNTNGVLVKSAVGNATLSLEQGVYIVKVGKESFKVGL